MSGYGVSPVATVLYGWCVVVARLKASAMLSQVPSRAVEARPSLVMMFYPDGTSLSYSWHKLASVLLPSNRAGLVRRKTSGSREWKTWFVLFRLIY